MSSTIFQGVTDPSIANTVSKMRTTIDNLLATNICSKQLEYTNEICDQASCHLKTKLIGVQSWMAWVC